MREGDAGIGDSMAAAAAAKKQHGEGSLHLSTLHRYHPPHLSLLYIVNEGGSIADIKQQQRRKIWQRVASRGVTYAEGAAKKKEKKTAVGIEK